MKQNQWNVNIRPQPSHHSYCSIDLTYGTPRSYNSMFYLPSIVTLTDAFITIKRLRLARYSNVMHVLTAPELIFRDIWILECCLWFGIQYCYCYSRVLVVWPLYLLSSMSPQLFCDSNDLTIVFKAILEAAFRILIAFREDTHTKWCGDINCSQMQHFAGSLLNGYRNVRTLDVSLLDSSRECRA